ncbi:Uncharacterised protein [Mycobacteroides abscessus subsp. abscessus]|nr:Uncharacterised protein [Mycobacteroides abscessus subsp. abscessus]
MPATGTGFQVASLFGAGGSRAMAEATAGSFRFTAQSSLVDGSLGLTGALGCPGDGGVDDGEAMVFVGVFDTVLSPPVHAQASADSTTSRVVSTGGVVPRTILRTAPDTTDIYRRCRGGGS